MLPMRDSYAICETHMPSMKESRLGEYMSSMKESRLGEYMSFMKESRLGESMHTYLNNKLNTASDDSHPSESMHILQKLKTGPGACFYGAL